MSFRVASTIVGLLCLLWWISFVFILLFQCMPIQKDFAIILLPLRVVRKLKLPLAEKIILCFIFIIGSFVGVISIIRRVFVYNAADFSGTSYGRTNWLPIQLAMAVICCCLPTYRPLLPNDTAIMASLVSRCSSIGSLVPRKQRSAIPSASCGRNIDSESITRSRHNCYNNMSGHCDKSSVSVWTNAIGAGRGRFGLGSVFSS